MASITQPLFIQIGDSLTSRIPEGSFTRFIAEGYNRKVNHQTYAEGGYNAPKLFEECYGKELSSDGSTSDTMPTSSTVFAKKGVPCQPVKGVVLFVGTNDACKPGTWTNQYTDPDDFEQIITEMGWNQLDRTRSEFEISNSKTTLWLVTVPLLEKDKMSKSMAERRNNSLTAIYSQRIRNAYNTLKSGLESMDIPENEKSEIRLLDLHSAMLEKIKYCKANGFKVPDLTYDGQHLSKEGNRLLINLFAQDLQVIKDQSLNFFNPVTCPPRWPRVTHALGWPDDKKESVDADDKKQLQELWEQATSWTYETVPTTIADSTSASTDPIPSLE